jgi:hypothetical protein
MQIRARMCMSADGYVTTADGWPAQHADPAFAAGTSHGIVEFLDGCEAALMGRTTFEPALTADRWFGDGMQLTPSLSPDTRLTLESQRAIPGGSVEIIRCRPRRYG